MAEFFNNEPKDKRIGCKKCGFPGHLTYQCRNFIKLDPNKKAFTLVESASSDEEVEHYLTPLQELRKQELEAEERERAQRKQRKKEKKRKDKEEKKKKKRKRRSDSSSSDVERKRKKQKKKEKKKKRESSSE